MMPVVMILKLDVLLSDKVFDLYSQSPWVTGSQMAAISDWSLFVGLELLSEGDCFGAVIHIYNMLQQLDVECKRIPILEHLQTLFKSKVFAGRSEPQRSFSSIFELFCGGAKILQAQGVRLLHRSKPKETCVSSKFSKISLAEMHSSTTQSFFHLYMPSAKFWTRLTDNPRIVQRYTTHENLFAQFPPSDTIRRAEEIIRPEYEGAFPIARLNCFAVLRLCQDIMLAIAARFQVLGTAAWPPGMEDIGSPSVLHIPSGIEPYVKIEVAVKCVRITMILIDGLLDGYALTRKRSDVGYSKMWKEHPDAMRPVVVMRDTIAEVCEGKKVEDFLWKSM
ncbi:hypothetical protein J4E83_007011 [Alternaria metachromatica]|uniref:uncharacterized protein n=1 Tax=Alternaria metachromatica TaxID=283354 RepID=UPI0020C1FF91|nr:uncharacterized protein J4E83_007011 [Alternaria metachromatica]KAI4615284.1 hypothetical protein J4E83_007011 [Alternaria metachromatica]